MTPQALGGGIVDFTGGPQGGSISVNDTYGSPVTGAQTANGPTLPYPQAGKASIAQAPGTCEYAVVFSFTIATTSSGTFPPVPDGGATALVGSPVVPIPSDLKLCGTASVPWEGQPAAGKGSYTATGAAILGQGDEWPTTFNNFLAESGQQPGFATINWCFTPTTGPSSSCSVGGGTIASAAVWPGGVRAKAAQQQTCILTCNPDTKVCTCTPVATCETKQERFKRLKKKYLARVVLFGGLLSAWFGMAALAATLTPGAEEFAPYFTSAMIGTGAGTAIASYLASLDPPDPRWRSIVTAHPMGLVTLHPNALLTPGAARAANAIFKQIAIVNGLERAAAISANRAGSARAAHNRVWFKRQVRALGRFLMQAGEAITQLVTSIRQSQPTLSMSVPGLTPAKVSHAAAYVRAHGLPKSFIRLAERYGASTSLLDAVKQKLKSKAPLPSYATSLYGLLSYAPFITAEQRAANAMLTYGALLLAHP
jgi:hypothetical protein